MTYFIAVFSIRTDTVQFYAFLNKNGVPASIVETPKGATASCGISVKFSGTYINKVRKLLFQSGIRSFVSFYLVSGIYGRTTLTPIK